MQVSIISPTPYLDKFTSQSDLHLILAHKVLEDDTYAKFYANETKFKILDNSVYELGKPLDADSLIQAAMRVNPDEIAYPDYVGDGVATLNACKKFHPTVQKHFPRKARMIIPQGHDMTEWLWCLQELINLTGHSTRDLTIGIGFQNCNVFEAFNPGMAFDRVYVASYLARLYPYNIHLLGGGDNAGELCWYGEEIRVRSIDTAIPIIAGAANEKFATGGWIRNGRRLDWKNTNYTSEQLETIQYNIDRLKRWAYGNSKSVL